MGCKGSSYPHQWGKWRRSTAKHLQHPSVVRACGCGARQYKRLTQPAVSNSEHS